MTTIPLVQVAANDARVACTLNADQYQAHTAELSRLAARALIDRLPIEGGQRLTFIDIPAVERELRAAVAAESSCCSFLTMRLARADGELILDVTGPAPAEPIIAELFASTSSARSPARAKSSCPSAAPTSRSPQPRQGAA